MSKTQKKPIINKNYSSVGKQAVKTTNLKSGKKTELTQKPVPRDSKQTILITLLQRPAGATISEMTSVTGWQQHSVRGVISGALKKRLGLPVISVQEERGRVYRIAVVA